MNLPTINDPQGERHYCCMFPATPGDGPKPPVKVNEPVRREAPGRPSALGESATFLGQLLGGLLLFVLGVAMVVGLVAIVLLVASHGRL